MKITLEEVYSKGTQESEEGSWLESISRGSSREVFKAKESTKIMLEINNGKSRERLWGEGIKVSLTNIENRTRGY